MKHFLLLTLFTLPIFTFGQSLEYQDIEVGFHYAPVDSIDEKQISMGYHQLRAGLDTKNVGNIFYGISAVAIGYGFLSEHIDPTENGSGYYVTGAVFAGVGFICHIAGNSIMKNGARRLELYGSGFRVKF